MFGSKIRLGEAWAEKEIAYYESLPVQKGRILFYGDSTFSRCSSLFCHVHGNPDIEKELLAKDGSGTVLNHGFGGSTAEAQLYYYRRMVLPYEPRALVLSAFGNDFDFGYGLNEIMEIQGRIVDYAQRDFPGIPIYICSCYPSPREEKATDLNFKALARACRAYNDLLDVYCAAKPGVTCLRLQDMEFLFNDPKDAGGYENLREDVFAEDGAHFNALGYGYFFEYLREKLDDLL